MLLLLDTDSRIAYLHLLKQPLYDQGSSSVNQKYKDFPCIRGNDIHQEQDILVGEIHETNYEISLPDKIALSALNAHEACFLEIFIRVATIHLDYE